MVKKIMILGIALVMCLGFFSACPGYGIDYTCVIVYVKKEYYEKFNTKGFALEDFELDNIEDFSYFYYHPDEDIEKYGTSIISDVNKNKFILLKLKKTGKKYVDEAIEHLNKLDFVWLASSKSLTANPGTELN